MRAGFFVLGIAVAGCSQGRPGVSISPVTDASPITQPQDQDEDPFDQAVVAFHDAENAGPLGKWVDAHPEDPRAELWREILAMRMYERFVFGPTDRETTPQLGDDPALEPVLGANEAQLRSVLAAYPGTLGARNASARLSANALDALRDPVLNPKAVAFLDGDDSVCGLAEVDDFRLQYQPGIRLRVGREILARGCEDAMGYCTWWVLAFPKDAEFTPGIQAQQEDAWFRRARPRWQSGRFARCAARCAKGCRAEAAPLDDSCYDPCIAKCQAAEG